MRSRHCAASGGAARARRLTQAEGLTPESGVRVAVSRTRKRTTASWPANSSGAAPADATGSIVNSTSTPSLTIFCGPRLASAVEAGRQV